MNYFKGHGVDACEKNDNFFEKVLKVKDVQFLPLQISFSASWSTTSVKYSSNLKSRIGSERGGPGRAADIASHMQVMVEATTMWGSRLIRGTSRGWSHLQCHRDVYRRFGQVCI